MTEKMDWSFTHHHADAGTANPLDKLVKHYLSQLVVSQLKACCKKHGLKVSGKKAELQARLFQAYRLHGPDKFDVESLNMMPPVNWITSSAREIIIDDLYAGILSLDEEDLSAEDAWETCYSQLYEFQSVPFEQFKAQLKDHREQVKLKWVRSKADKTALEHDRQLYPRKSHNSRGELVFDLSPAKPLLQEDIKNKAHEGKTPREFQLTRPEYLMFKPKIFKERIYQEIATQKFYYSLELKRIEKAKRQAKKKYDDATKGQDNTTK